MSEEYLRLNGPDGHGLYVKLRQKDGNTSLSIHLHGLTHTMNHMLEVTGAEFFVQEGFDHYRIGFYDRMPDSRKLNTISLNDHVADIHAVITHFKDSYDQIFVTAHSLSGLCMLIANPDITAMSLWDPAFDVTHFWEVVGCLTPLPDHSVYHLDYGNVFAISDALVDQIKDYPDAQCLKLAQEVTTPTQMIIPETSIFLASPHTSPDNYKDAFSGDFTLQHMKAANHTFSEIGNQEKLFKETCRWFNRYR